jgi:hypothetical protein
VDTFYCISTSSTYEGIIENLKKIVKRYRNTLKLLAALERTEEGGRIRNENERDRQVKLFKEQGGLYALDIKKAVYDALDEVKMDKPVVKNAGKVKLLKVHVPHIEKREEVVDNVTAKCGLKKSPCVTLKKLKIE